MKNEYERYYSLDLVDNKFPRITEKNLAFIKAILSIDSNYRADFLQNGGTYTQDLREHGFPKTKKNLKDVLDSLNKMNSTRGDVGDSINKMADFLCDRVGLEKAAARIQQGDLSIVTELANANPDRFNISLASKFCTYCSQICFGGDSFSKYDRVVSTVLPYYAWLYLGENRWVRTSRRETRISLTTKDSKDWSYESYCELIGRIVKAICEKEKIAVTRQDFDWVVWYFFKGDKERQADALKAIK